MAWIAVSERVLRILFLVPNDSPVQAIDDLRGKNVATIAPMTITAQVAASILRQHHLEPGRTVEVLHRNTPANAAQAALLGEAAATAFPSVSLPGLPSDMRRQLRPIHESRDLPSIAFLAHIAGDAPVPEAMQTALFRFARETDEGKEFLRRFNHDGLRAPDLKAMHMLDQYLPELKRQLIPD
jgi:ABC-type phosphate/phosphonate transport system substrate-binding protein